jgi:hypothetical protein
VAQGLPLPP